MFRNLFKIFSKQPVKIEYSRESLIRLKIEDSKSNYLDGFWKWVKLLENKEYLAALESLYWEKATTWTPESLESRITTFFGGKDAWSVVIPNDRLVKKLNELTDIDLGDQNKEGWMMARIPVTTQTDNAKDDDIPLMGLAVSFFVREYQGNYVLEHEIFHL